MAIDTSKIDIDSPAVIKVRRREELLRKVIDRYPTADKENVWHTLVLLESPPLERLEGALRRSGKCIKRK